MAEPQRLQPIDAESEACFPLMTELIAAEIAARIAVRDDNVDDPEWTLRVARLAADALLDSFRVRPIGDGDRRWMRPG